MVNTFLYIYRIYTRIFYNFRLSAKSLLVNFARSTLFLVIVPSSSKPLLFTIFSYQNMGQSKTYSKKFLFVHFCNLQQESSRRPAGREIILDENCRIIRGEGAATFEIVTGKKTYYLTADSTAAVDDWVRVLQVLGCNHMFIIITFLRDHDQTHHTLLEPIAS